VLIYQSSVFKSAEVGLEGATSSMPQQLSLDMIRVVDTPFLEPAGTPIQPSQASGARETFRMDPRLHAGLKDLEVFERMWLIHWFHKAPDSSLLVTPILDECQRGAFATRPPARPTPIGISTVPSLSVHGGTLEIADVDCLDCTHLLDVKPYIQEFDFYASSRSGCLDESGSHRRVPHERVDSPGAKERKEK
jgi:tRNA-Thr(GGU) m(6)t(6)A37 methyltransferase TsaA